MITRVGAAIQLGCVVVGVWLLVGLEPAMGARAFYELLGLTAVVTGVTLAAWVLAAREHRAALGLAQSMAEERRLTATLEQTVEDRTSELEEAQRVLQRMWWLGQQIALELNPKRVLGRFLEAVCDIAQADGGTVALVGEDGNLHVVVGTGLLAQFHGVSVPISNSAMGRVLRSGAAWTVSDINEHPEKFPAYDQLKGSVVSLAIVPISRRGERIGGVTLVTRDARNFTTADLERIESLSDLLSVALENAELVETLRQTEWRFRTLFRAAPDAVLTVLQNGTIREANDAVRDLAAVEPRQLVGREVVDLVIDQDRDRLRSALNATLAGSPARLEVSFQRDDNTRSQRLVALAMSKLPEADPPSVLVVGRDVTKERDMRVRMMEADRLAAIGELVAGVAHEVNNPLTSISAFAQIVLRDESLTPSQRESVEVIRSETMRATQVVKDLLAFSRRSEPQWEPVNLNTILTRTLRLRGYQMTSNKISVESDFDTDLPTVIGDGRQLQQVCLNLVINAVQAMTPLGGGTLRLMTRRDDGKVVIDVQDTGPGIPASVKPRIFEPFFTTKDEGEGTGLGLSVSYGIIAAHGGTIGVADTSPQGTTMRITIPSREAQ